MPNIEVVHNGKTTVDYYVDAARGFVAEHLSTENSRTIYRTPGYGEIIIGSAPKIVNEHSDLLIVHRRTTRSRSEGSHIADSLATISGLEIPYCRGEIITPQRPASMSRSDRRLLAQVREALQLAA